MKKRRCPKCGGKISHYTEHYDQAMVFTADENGVAADEGIVCMPTGIVGVEATCEVCKHVWKVRGVSQIPELRAKKIGEMV